MQNWTNVLAKTFQNSVPDATYMSVLMSVFLYMSDRVHVLFRVYVLFHVHVQVHVQTT
jgi:hypothetical protein